MVHEGKIRNGSIELNISSAKIFKFNYNKDRLRKFNIDYDLFIKAYPNINNFCSNLILVDDLELFRHDALNEDITNLMKDKRRYIITTNADTVNTELQNDWLFEGMGEYGEKEYFPNTDTLICKTKNCKVFIVNEILCECPNEKQ